MATDDPQEPASFKYTGLQNTATTTQSNLQSLWRHSPCAPLSSYLSSWASLPSRLNGLLTVAWRMHLGSRLCAFAADAPSPFLLLPPPPPLTGPDQHWPLWLTCPVSQLACGPNGQGHAWGLEFQNLRAGRNLETSSSDFFIWQMRKLSPRNRHRLTEATGSCDRSRMRWIQGLPLSPVNLSDLLLHSIFLEKSFLWSWKCRANSGLLSHSPNRHCA